LNRLLDGLNPPQREAVTHLGSPLLVLAGAGSGKTRVLTRRLSWLVATGEAEPWQILAVTFTNKAAAEMRRRVEEQLGRSVRGLWVQTFHSACLRMLRHHHVEAGLAEDFRVFDTGDQQDVLRRILKARKQDAPRWATPGAMMSRIDRIKRDMVTPDEYEERAFDAATRFTAAVFRDFEDELKRADALDFNDLINRCVLLLESDPDVREAFRRRFRHVLVDEVQDTNPPQFRLLHALADGHKRITVVGDDDQSIYGFRGADVSNILGFEGHFEGARVVRLEQNYRSTQTVLDAATAVVRSLPGRHPKELWTEHPKGERVQLRRTEDPYDEARQVAAEVGRQRAAGRRLRDMAVFFRTNAQSRVFEEVLAGAGVPYVLVGARRFYDRKEIKDAVAYLRLLNRPDDVLSLARVVNVPARGIGAASQERLYRAAQRLGVGAITGLEEILEAEAKLKRAAPRLREFAATLETQRAAMEDRSLHDIVSELLEASGYAPALREADDHDSHRQLENLQELVQQATFGIAEGLTGTEAVQVFLDHVALIADADNAPGEGEAHDAMTLMTVHCAKGLEFDVVFVVGMEEGRFPHQRALDEGELDEERRLCYVAFTRARQLLWLSWADFRPRFGPCEPSGFLTEIPEELTEGDRPRVEELPMTAARASFLSIGREPRVVERGGGERVVYDDDGWWSPGEAGAEGEDGQTWRTGQVVRHASFGQGVIRKVSGRGHSAKLTIDFLRSGRKRVVARYAGLTLVRDR
jgi:DNA helicase-2/ATP-dependent DNA helicase PcrA